MTASVDLLKAARAKIADPKHWTRHRLACDRSGRPVEPKSKRAACWCVHGALDAVGCGRFSPEVSLLFEVAGEKFGREPYLVNDTLSHNTVLKMLDFTIAKAEASNA